MKTTSMFLLVALAACGGRSTMSAIPASSETVKQGAPSIAKISKETLKEHVSILASDEFGGRGTLEAGEKKPLSEWTVGVQRCNEFSVVSNG